MSLRRRGVCSTRGPASHGPRPVIFLSPSRARMLRSAGFRRARGLLLLRATFQMKLAMLKKTGTRRRSDDPLEAQLVRLSRQNAAFRKEIARLEAYRALAYRDPLTSLW